jgi:hypothetical protein
MQSNRVALDHLTQLVQTLMDDRTRPLGGGPESSPHFRDLQQGTNGRGSSYHEGSGRQTEIRSFQLEFPSFHYKKISNWPRSVSHVYGQCTRG